MAPDGSAFAAFAALAPRPPNALLWAHADVDATASKHDERISCLKIGFVAIQYIFMLVFFV
ncbi:MAG: hypothetical protein RSF79_07355 [Janthinobacterium sp.]